MLKCFDSITPAVTKAAAAEIQNGQVISMAYNLVNGIPLFGTRFTMHGRFYPEVFTREGLQLTVPTADEQDYIHDKYIDELIPGKFLPETRHGLTAIATRMRTSRSAVC